MMTYKLKELRRLVADLDRRREGGNGFYREAHLAWPRVRNAADALIEVAEAARAVRKHLPMTDYTDNQRKNIAVISDTIALDDALRKLEGQDDG